MLWSGTLTQTKPLAFESPFDLRITGVCLGKGAVEGERVILIMTHEDFLEEEPRTTPVCTLSAGNNENVHLDLILDEGEPVSFACAGSGEVHLTGYFVIEDGGEEELGMDDERLNAMFEEDSEDETFEGASMEDDSEDISDDSEEPRIEEVDNDILAKVREKQALLAKRKEIQRTDSPAKKKQKTRTSMDIDESPKKQPTTPQKSPKGKKEVVTPQKSPKGKKEVATPEKSPKAKKEVTTPQKTRVQQLRGGTVAEITKVGRGSQTASNGQKVTVKYAGKLAKSGKQFDAGKFSFKLGKGEVIKGMDVGVQGMLVGETRKITIPFDQAYGKGGTSGIPPKSDLIFTVSMISMK